MGSTVDVVIPVDAETARLLSSSARREAVGRYLGSLLSGQGGASALAEAIADAKQEARANGLTDEVIDAELEAWRAEPTA